MTFSSNILKSHPILAGKLYNRIGDNIVVFDDHKILPKPVKVAPRNDTSFSKSLVGRNMLPQISNFKNESQSSIDSSLTSKRTVKGEKRKAQINRKNLTSNEKIRLLQSI